VTSNKTWTEWLPICLSNMRPYKKKPHVSKLSSIKTKQNCLKWLIFFLGIAGGSTGVIRDHPGFHPLSTGVRGPVVPGEATYGADLKSLARPAPQTLPPWYDMDKAMPPHHLTSFRREWSSASGSWQCGRQIQLLGVWPSDRSLTRAYLDVVIICLRASIVCIIWALNSLLMWYCLEASAGLADCLANNQAHTCSCVCSRNK
jgi:hypothetical protein